MLDYNNNAVSLVVAAIKSKHRQMKYVSLKDNSPRRLSFYLAMEEYVARNIDEQDCFFHWQVKPSVIFGRNQLIENEVNIDYCRSHGIQMYRRKSGGGCVYADMSNVMFSYITGEDNVGFTFNRYINMMILVLRKMGVEAHTSGRNDILIGDRKVSGNAFYKLPGKSIVHGTMLYDTDIENMVGSITPSDEKLMSKGVSSVRQRIALLKDFIDMDIEQFKRFVVNNLCNGTIVLEDDDIRKIEEIEQEYLSPEFIYGNNPSYTVIRKGRIEGAGDFEVRMDVKNNVIKKANLLGDFFILGDINAGITDRLKGVPLEAGKIREALPERLDDVVMNLKREDLVKLIAGDN